MPLGSPCKPPFFFALCGRLVPHLRPTPTRGKYDARSVDGLRRLEGDSHHLITRADRHHLSGVHQPNRQSRPTHPHLPRFLPSKLQSVSQLFFLPLCESVFGIFHIYIFIVIFIVLGDIDAGQSKLLLSFRILKGEFAMYRNISN
jgi:hypothetical protein